MSDFLGAKMNGTHIGGGLDFFQNVKIKAFEMLNTVLRPFCGSSPLQAN